MKLTMCLYTVKSLSNIIDMQNKLAEYNIQFQSTTYNHKMY